MKQILIQLDDRTATELEKVAPARSHKRSAFIRSAIVHALQQAREQRTREAYEKWPDEPAPVDAAEWAPEDEALRPATRQSRAPARRKAARR